MAIFRILRHQHLIEKSELRKIGHFRLSRYVEIVRREIWASRFLCVWRAGPTTGVQDVRELLLEGSLWIFVLRGVIVFIMLDENPVRVYCPSLYMSQLSALTAWGGAQ